ncbi:MAG: hypothetical protein JRH20_20265 [Deltaproteobacteria bacterium]|nr:hypothetical protein [Deltaproteobacteria bacterium]
MREVWRSFGEVRGKATKGTMLRRLEKGVKLAKELEATMAAGDWVKVEKQLGQLGKLRKAIAKDKRRLNTIMRSE